MMRKGILPLLFLGVLSLTALFAPHLVIFSPDHQDLSHALSGPTLLHPLGTDELGRDMLSRLLYGARITLAISLTSSFMAVIAGVAVGILAGMGGRKVDNLLMRVVDFFYSIPDLLLIVLITVIFGKSIFTITLAISLTSWASVSRIVRNEVLSLKSADFFSAAFAEGQHIFRVVSYHLFPNILMVILVVLSLRVPSAIIAESSLSFLGLGLNPPASSWGVLCQTGFRAMAFYPHLIFPPAVAIFVTVYALNELADALSQTSRPWVER